MNCPYGALAREPLSSPSELSTPQFHRDRESGGKDAANPLLGGKEETCPALRAVWRTRFLFVPRSGGVGPGTPVGPGQPTPAFGHPSQEGMGQTPVLASVKLSCREPSERGDEGQTAKQVHLHHTSLRSAGFQPAWRPGWPPSQAGRPCLAAGCQPLSFPPSVDWHGDNVS